jgi:hypothetical protein
LHTRLPTCSARHGFSGVASMRPTCPGNELECISIV